MFIIKPFEMSFRDTPSKDVAYARFFFDGYNNYTASEVAERLLEDSEGIPQNILIEAVKNTIEHFPQYLRLQHDIDIFMEARKRDENITVFFGVFERFNFRHHSNKN